MPRNGLGMPITSSSVGGAVLNVDDVLWESFGSDEIAINYAENYTNIVLHSQDATDAEAWTKTNTAIDSTLYEAPDNSTTANAIKSNSTGEKAYKIQQSSLSVTAGKTYTLSVHLKKQNLSFAKFQLNDSAANYDADFNLTTAAVTNTGNLIRTQVDKIDGDWYRCSITFKAQNTSSAATATVFAQSAAGDATPNVAVSGIVLIYVWGFQLEENIEASPYIVTTTEARTATETLNDLSSIWDFDSADIMPEADPDSEGAWETLDNLVLNGTYEELGSDLVTNGDFSTAGTLTSSSYSLGWSSPDSGISISSGVLNLTRVSSGGRAYASNGSNGGLAITSGKTYQLTYTITENTDNSTLQYHNGGAYVSTSSSVPGTYTVTYVAAGTIFLFRNNSIDTTIKLDNVSLKQVDPNNRWTLGTGWSIEDGKAVAVATDTAGFSITQSNVLTAGVPHEITFTVSERTAGNVRFRADAVSGTTRSADGTYTEIITPAGHQFAIQGLNSFVGKIDNVTVREYAIQPQDV